MLTVALIVVGSNLLADGSFEKAAKDHGDWQKQTWAGKASFSLRNVDTAHGISAEISSESGADAAYTTTIYVKPFSKYKLTGFIKCTNVLPANKGLGALINIHGQKEKTAALTGTHDWTRVEVMVETAKTDVLQINCLLGYFGTAKGIAWFDDISLEWVSSKPLNDRVVLDASQKLEPISPYIYGQFIEHLGRCIFGGIWAEMIVDRKFFHDVGKSGSPWRLLENSRSEPTKFEVFVGERTNRIFGGIEQGGLSFVPRKEYTGHVWLRGVAAHQTVIVSIEGIPYDCKVGENWKKFGFSYRATKEVSTGRIQISSSQPFDIGAISMMPADNISGMRRDVIGLLKELNAPIYRWPGGNFVSGYNWRDGIGDRDRRSPRKNPAWQGIEDNDFGTHEFLEFCRVLGTEPLIVVNTGFGDANSGCDWLQYVNGTSDAMRANNGRKGPWNVRWWGIGNEMFGTWQLGYIPREQYVLKHNDFVHRMRRIDPTIKTIAVGDVGNGWSKAMLTHCADQMTLLSEHFYCQELQGVIAHAEQIPAAIRAKAKAHRDYRQQMPGLAKKDIRIAMDEWNYWYGPEVFGELGTRFFMKDALGIAAGLHEFFRNTDIIGMAQYAQTVNVIGAIKTTPTDAAFETTGLVLKMYREHFGEIPIAVDLSNLVLDVSAALTLDRKEITVGVVNPTEATVELPLILRNANLAESGESWTISSDNPMAHNQPGQTPMVAIKYGLVKQSIQLTLKPYSITIARFAIQN